MFTPVIIPNSGADIGDNIANSMRLRSSASPSLSRTFGTPTDQKKWLFKAEVKRGKITSQQYFFVGNADPGAFNEWAAFQFDSNDKLHFTQLTGGATNLECTTDMVFRDPSAWYQIIAQYDSTQATAADRFVVWVNGVRVSLTYTTGPIAQNTVSQINRASTIHYLGRYISASLYSDLTFADVCFVDGLTYASTNNQFFGRTSPDTGAWVHKNYTGEYGANGFRQQYSNIVAAADFGVDSSGNTVPSTLLLSDDPGNATYYNSTNGTATSRQANDSYGVLALASYVSSNTLSSHLCYHTQLTGLDANSRYRLSAEFKPGTEPYAMLSWATGGFASGGSAVLDLSTGAVTQRTYGTGSIQEASVQLVNGVYRVTLVATLDSSSTAGFASIGATNSAGDASVLASGTFYVGHVQAGRVVSLSPSDKNANVTLSGGNLTATSTSGWFCARATKGVSRGKFYYEYVENNSYSVGTILGGVGKSTATLIDGAYLGYDANGWGFANYSAAVFNNSTAPIVGLPSGTPGNRVGIAVNLTSSTGTMDLYRNGSLVTSGINIGTGTWFPMVSVQNFATGTTSCTVYLSAATQLYRPSGYNAWDVTNNMFDVTNVSATAGVTMDSLTDTPTNNYATLDPLDPNRGGNPQNGNLDIAGTQSCKGNWLLVNGSGKWVWEFVATGVSGTALCGVATDDVNATITAGTAYVLYRSSDGQKHVNSTTPSAYGATWASGDVIRVEFDATTQTVTFFKNGTSQGAIAATAGLNYRPFVVQSSGTTTYTLNFGQRSFSGTPTTGFKALCTANLPTPTVLRGDNHFDAVTYTGNGSAGLTVANRRGFQPGALVFKDRGAGGSNTSNQWFNSVAGHGKVMYSDNTNAEFNSGTAWYSIGSTGPILTASGQLNTNAEPYLNLQLKDGGAAVPVAGNAISFPEDFTNAAWGKSNVTITADQVAAPDGTTTAELLANNDSVGVNFHYIAQAPSLTQSQTYTVSAYVKYLSGSGIVWLLGETNTNAFCYFNVITGVVTQSTGFVSAGIEAVSNGFYRISATFTKTSVTATEQVGVGVCLATGTPNWNSTGLANQEKIYVWGAQLTATSSSPSYPMPSTSVISIPSMVSANVAAGFSIVTYTGTGANATVGHGLGVAPKLIIIKNRASAQNWTAYHASAGNTGALFPNLTAAVSVSSGYFNNTSPTSTVFTVGTNPGVNNTGESLVAYCFAEIDGYSKIGTYTGNGSTDGTPVWCGFRPRWVLIKRTDTTGDWYMWDTTRNTFNVTNLELLANSSAAETTASDLDINSSSFKFRNTTAGFNAAGGTYIFMAIAETPFKYANAR